MTLLVSAAIVVEHGRVLITQRRAGTHLAGLWEFPGGKVDADEDPRHALQRELREELGIETNIGEIIDVTFHRYGEKSMLLMFFKAQRTATSPAPRAIEVADFKWGTCTDLTDTHFPEADLNVLRKVRLMCQ